MCLLRRKRKTYLVKNSTLRQSLVRHSTPDPFVRSLAGAAKQDRSLSRRLFDRSANLSRLGVNRSLCVRALLSTATLAIMVRKQRKVFVLTLIALLCIVGTQVLFWTFNYPANQLTNNWTVLPENWQELRKQWEYSHATSAVLSLIAVITLILSILVRDE